MDQTEMNVQARLIELAEPEYRDFSARLARSELPMLGVRLPALRSLAKETVRSGEGERFCREPHRTFEEVMLHGMILGLLRVDSKTRIRLIDEFLPAVENWSVCDSTCAGLKEIAERPDDYLPFLLRCAEAEPPFRQRFAVVCAMNHLLTERDADRAIALMFCARSEAYYVRMGVAWALATALAKFPERTFAALAANDLDETTARMLLSKAKQSYRVDAETTERLRSELFHS